MFFETHIRVPFADVDHAGVVYFAQILHYCHVALEELHECVGLPLNEFFEQRQLGEPLVDVRAHYRRPSRHGEWLRINVGFERLGEKSLVSRHRVLGPDVDADDVRSLVRIVQVCSNMTRFASTPIPDDVRAAFTPYLLSPEELASTRWPGDISDP